MKTPNILGSAEVYDIFPIPLYKIMSVNLDSCNEYLESINEFDDFGNIYGRKSKNTYLLNNPECYGLNEFIKTHMEIYARNLLAWKINSVKMLQSWISVKYKNEMHDTHYHPNSALSCVYYFSDYSEDTAPLIFVRNPVICQLMNQFSPDIDYGVGEKVEYTHSQFLVKPKKNMLVIFPSWVHHYVVSNKSEIPRKSLSANAIPLGIMGSRSQTSELNLD